MVPGYFSEEICWMKAITGIMSINCMFTTNRIRKTHPKVTGSVNGNQGCYIYVVTTVLNT